MLATTSIGAIWTACSPDFGWRGVLDRFRQLQPKVLFAVDGYSYGGQVLDRRDEVRQIVGGLRGLEYVVHLSYLSGPGRSGRPRGGADGRGRSAGRTWAA